MAAVKTSVAKDVDEYMDRLPADVRGVLDQVRLAIRSAAPKAEEVISYQIPTYKQHGPLIHFVAQKNHCSLIVVSKSVMEMFEKELSSFKTTGRTIHFSPEKPISASLIKKIVKIRIKENEELDAVKKLVAGKKRK